MPQNSERSPDEILQFQNIITSTFLNTILQKNRFCALRIYEDNIKILEENAKMREVEVSFFI